MKQTKNQQNAPKLKPAPAFYFAVVIVGLAAITGLVNNELLVEIFHRIFDISLEHLGWVYQLMMMASLIVVTLITFSRAGSIRIGGKDAVPKYSFGSWFAMTLTGGIATGIIVGGVSEPITYFENLYGELDALGIEAGSTQAGIFAISRCFYHWGLVPYSTFALVGVTIAVVYFNYHKRLSISSTLVPLFGSWANRKGPECLIDTISLIAISLGLAGSLGNGIVLIQSGLQIQYGLSGSPKLMLLICCAFVFIYMADALTGIEKGIRFTANANTYLFYFLMLVVFLLGPKTQLFQLMLSAIGNWLDQFWQWGFDSGLVGGEPLVKWWTLQTFCFYFCYAPTTGIFLAQISYGRTVREFMLVNWLLPSAFVTIWFTIWGGNAIAMDAAGTAQIGKTILESGSASGLWELLRHIPFSQILVPLLLVVMVLSFSTAADSLVNAMGTICTRGLSIGQEPPRWQLLIWGTLPAVIAYVMVAYGNGVQGLEGIKYIGSAAGVVIFFLYILQIVSAVKLFFGSRKPPKEL